MQGGGRTSPQESCTAPETVPLCIVSIAAGAMTHESRGDGRGGGEGQEEGRTVGGAGGGKRPAVFSTHTNAEERNRGNLNTGNDDLTSLSWLQSLDLMGGVVPHIATPPTPPASPPPSSFFDKRRKTDGADGGGLGRSSCSMTPGTASSRSAASAPPREPVDYSRDGSVKPPFSYAALIGMAMKENQNKMTLSAIYSWIRENFVYYKTADPSWQNSIRHNLSLNKCFLKVPRNKDEPGKGGFWRLDPEYADSLVDGVFKKRRASKPTPPPAAKGRKINKRLPHLQQRQQQQPQLAKFLQQQLQQNQGQEQVKTKVVVQPVQAAFMPPPTNKPPPIEGIFLRSSGDDLLKTSDEKSDDLKGEMVWSTILPDDGTAGCPSEVMATSDDVSWRYRTEELVTDLAQSGDPSTYHNDTVVTSSLLENADLVHTLVATSCATQIQSHTTTASSIMLPSLDFSPVSLGVEEDLFTSPEYSEASNDSPDTLTSTLEFATACGGCGSGRGDGGGGEGGANGGNVESSTVLEPSDWAKYGCCDLPSISSFSSVAQLTPLEPSPLTTSSISSSSCPVVVQDAHGFPEHTWDESKTLSLLDANLDLENLIDLDVL